MGKGLESHSAVSSRAAMTRVGVAFTRLSALLLPLRSSTNELAVLISRMQTNADQVEKDILETQSKLQQVSYGRGGWQGERLCPERQRLG